MVDKDFLKRLNEKIDKLKVINIQDNPDSYLLIRLLTNGFFNEGFRDKQSVIDYVRGYNFSFILDEHGAPRADDTAIKNSIDLGYFLIFAANKYGAEFVLKQCLLDSVDLEKHSKLNPINWFLWILNKLAWSEIKANKASASASASDENFCRAIKRFQNLKSASTINLFTDPMLHEDLKIIIQKIAGEVGRKEELKIGESKQVPELVAPAAVNTSANPLPALPVANTSSNQPPVTGSAPPPPPPPPPPMQETPPPLPIQETLPSPSGKDERSEMLQQIREGTKLKQVAEEPKKPENARDEMLEKIRGGVKLKKVDKEDDKSVKPIEPNKESDTDSMEVIFKKALEDRRFAIAESSSSSSNESDSTWSDEETAVKKEKKLTKKRPRITSVGSNSSIEEQGNAAIGSQSEPKMRSKPPIPPKPRVEKKSVDAGALNRDSGISGGSESGDQPSPVSAVSVAALITGVGMFVDPPAGINNPQPCQSGVTPTMGL